MLNEINKIPVLCGCGVIVLSIISVLMGHPIWGVIFAAGGSGLLFFAYRER
jgi:hypothetical protein